MMVTSSRWRGYVFGALATAVLALSLMPTTSSAGPAVRTGRYVGRTSQGQPIKFKLVSARCSSPRAPRRIVKAICFQGQIYDANAQGYYPKLLEPCSDATVYSDPAYVDSYELALSASGRLAFSVHGLGETLVPNASVSTLTLAAHGSTVSGTLHQTESYDSGAGAVHCDSATVRFSARRVG